MPDLVPSNQIPQWPFMPGIEGQVPMPKPDPRSDMAKTLMSKAPIPMPRPDPRDWTKRVVPGLSEEGSLGAIHPDALMQSRGGGATVMPPNIDHNSVDPDAIMHNNSITKQRPLGMPPAMWQQDAGNGLFGVPVQHLQQMAGDVLPGPWQGVNALPGALGQAQNSVAAQKGGVGYPNTNVDLKLLDKLKL